MQQCELKQSLMELARDKGICKDGYMAMGERNMNSLIDYYIQNPDWCLERDFPTLSMLQNDFCDCENKGVFVGRRFKGEILTDLQTYIFHNCTGTIKVGLNISKSIIPMIYLANNCKLRIVGYGELAPTRETNRTIVSIYTFGKNDLSARDNRYVHFNVYKNELI